MTTKYDPDVSARLMAEAREAWEIGHHMPQRHAVAMADQLEAASLEILALKNANASLIPDAIPAVTNAECLEVERNAALAERNTLRDLVLEFLAAEEAWDVARWSDAGDDYKYKVSARRSDAHAALVAYRNTSKAP